MRLPVPGPLTRRTKQPFVCRGCLFVFDYKIVSLVYYCCKRFEIDTALNRVNTYFKRSRFGERPVVIASRGVMFVYPLHKDNITAVGFQLTFVTYCVVGTKFALK